MIGAVRSEVRKMLTVRATYLLAAGAAGIALITVFAAEAGVSPEAGTRLAEQQSWFFTSLLTRLVFVMLGIRVVTEEYRYGTITPSLLATGPRGRLLTAKLVAASAAAVVMAVLAQVTLVVAVAVVSAQNGLSLTLTGEDAAAMAGMLAAAALFAALGVGIGTLVRQPVPVTVGAVFWLLLGEDLLHLQIGDAAEYLPGFAGLALTAAPGATEAGPLLGAAVLLGWVAAATLAAAALLRRRDVG